MPDAMIRYFCSIDDTPTGKTSLAYADAFLAMGLSMRIIATRMGALGQQTQDGAAWAKHRAAFLTPIVNQYVNVVCGDPSDWRRLYTVGVKNVLITGTPPPHDDERAHGLAVPIISKDGRSEEIIRPKDEIAIEVALKYQVVIVPSEEISSQWKARGANTVVIPMELARHANDLKGALFS